MKPVALFLWGCLLAGSALGQRVRQTEHQHEVQDGDRHDLGHNHLSHIQNYRKETVYVHNLPSPLLLSGIGQTVLTINTNSPKTQAYFKQGVALLHCFWDFEAYRAFKEAIRYDSTAIMPYWGLYSAIGAIEGNDFKADKALAVARLRELKKTASEHEKLYAEGILLRDTEPVNGKKQYQQKLEIIVHKYPQDVDAKLFLALSKMGGYDPDMNPREGQLYSEVTGAWLGGTIDTTGAVVASGSLAGEAALKISTIVKFSQNVLLGVAAFAISLYWTYTQKGDNVSKEQKPTIGVIWDRFPKFILGFLAASLLFSFALPPDTIASVKDSLKSLQGLWFALAFTCIGLETRFADLINADNRRPLWAFLIAQTFNIVITLIIAFLLFN